jgi:hypothetical protein
MDDLIAKIQAKLVEDEAGCLCWTGRKTKNGYGRVKVGASFPTVHRIMYEALRGPVPEGLVLDHLCRNRICANVDHLEPVTNRENILRGVGCAAVNARKTHCDHGHPLSGANLRPNALDHRICLACYTARHQAHRSTLLRRGPDRLAITCSRGHPFVEGNIYYMGDRRTCRQCFLDRLREARARKRMHQPPRQPKPLPQPSEEVRVRYAFALARIRELQDKADPSAAEQRELGFARSVVEKFEKKWTILKESLGTPAMEI